jgi:hypothetical protein
MVQRGYDDRSCQVLARGARGSLRDYRGPVVEWDRDDRDAKAHEGHDVQVNFHERLALERASQVSKAALALCMDVPDVEEEDRACRYDQVVVVEEDRVHDVCRVRVHDLAVEDRIHGGVEGGDQSRCKACVRVTAVVDDFRGACHREAAEVVHARGQVLARAPLAVHETSSPLGGASIHPDQTPSHLGVRHQTVSPHQAVSLLVRDFPWHAQRRAHVLARTQATACP